MWSDITTPRKVVISPTSTPTVCMPPPRANLFRSAILDFYDEIEIEKFSLDSITADASIGYITECDLTYPDHLHDAHNNYPMAPEHLTVTRDMLSDYAVSCLLYTSPSPRDRTRSRMPSSA